MTDTSDKPIIVQRVCISCGTQTKRTFHDEAEAYAWRKRKIVQCRSCQLYAAEETP